MFLVDLPGYGYAKVTPAEKEKWGKMIERYLHTSKDLKAVFLLIDIRHKPSANEYQMYEWILHNGYEPIINDPGIVDLVISACRKNMGEDSVKIGEYDEGRDDFSYYMNATGTSGAYFFLLSGHEREECFVNHHPRFTWKEEAMKIGVESYLSVLMEYLN